MGIESSYTSPTNQTVLNTIDSASKTVSQYSSITNVSGAGVASAMESSFIQSGISAVTSILSVASALDSFTSGATTDFGPDSPIRSTVNSLAERNKAAENNQSPETKIDANKKLTNGGEDLSFPPNPAKHNITFNFYSYQRATPFANTQQNSIGKIILPLPDDLRDSTAAEWNSISLGATGLALDAIKNKENIGKDEILDSAARLALGVGKSFGPIVDTLVGRGTTETLMGVGSSELGIVSNPALSQLFKGIQFRNHSFAWTFAPKNEDESLMIKNIIRAFKKHSLPVFTSDVSAFFNYPDIVQPEFSFPEYLYEFKKCVINYVSVNYNVAGTPAFFKGTNAPIFIQLSVGLSEMEYVMSKDYGGYKEKTLVNKSKETLDKLNSALGL